MVVTRKSSATLSPPPAVSRTNSATASPRSRHKKIQPVQDAAASIAPAVGVAAPNDPSGREFADPPKVIGSSPLKQSATGSGTFSPTKKASPTKNTDMARPHGKNAVKTVITPKKASSSGFFRRLRPWIVVGLVGHALLVCPHDNKNESAVCSTVHDASSFLKYHVVDPYLLPQINELLANPKVANVVDPVVQATHPLVQKLAPAIHAGSAQLHHAYVHFTNVGHQQLVHHSSPYVRQLQDHYSSQIHPHVEKHIIPPYKLYIEPTWHQLEHWGRIAGIHAEPYLYQGVVLLQQAGRQAQPYAVIAWDRLAEVPGLVHRLAWEPMMEIRRTYVDPPLSKILETVNEATDEVKGSSGGFSTTFTARAVETPAEANGKVAEEAGTSASEGFTSTDAESASSTVDIEAEITGHPQSTSTTAEASPVEVEDEDLEMFLRELGAGDPEAEPPSPEAVPEEASQTASESRQSRKRETAAETAAKRADIVGRHEKWQSQISELSEKQVAELPKVLEGIRAEAVEELTAQNFADALNEEADRALKNTEAFVKRLVAGPGPSDVKISRLNDLVGKVQKKFEDSATRLSGIVASWWRDVQQVEGEAVEKLVQEVHDLGLTAQADLGLAYAWLDDVTVHDWARYHDLLNAAKSLRTHLVNLAEGSDADSPENALSSALHDLQVEMQNVVTRFQSDIQDIRKRGVSACEGTASEGHVADDPTFSILPVPDTPDHVEKHGEDVLRHTILQKSKEQVEDAIRMAEEAAATAGKKDAGAARVEL